MPPLGQLAGAALAELMQRMQACTADERWASDAGSVKQARIAARRLREALQLFGPDLQPKGAKQLVRNLEVLAAPLDVLRELDLAVSFLAVETERHAALGPALGQLHRDRRHAARRASQQLSVARLGQFASRLRRYQRAIAANVAIGDASVVGVLDAKLRARFERLVQRAEEIDLRTPATLHMLRRAVRRFRYDMEALDPWVRCDPELLNRVREAQDRLGTFTDCEAMLGLMESLPRADGPDVKIAIKQVGEELSRQMERHLDSIPATVAALLAHDHERLLTFSLARASNS